MSRQASIECIQAAEGFDYARLEPALADDVRAATLRIRGLVKRTLGAVVQAGLDLRQIKKSLPAKKFCAWLAAEFGWTRRTAARFMLVAGWLEGCWDTVSHLRLDPTAAYILTASSVPDTARTEALERALGGERITPKIAREIVDRALKKARGRTVSSAQLHSRLARVLERYLQRWPAEETPGMAERVRELRDALRASRKSSKKRG